MLEKIPVITIKEARKILGKCSIGLNDTQINDLIDMLNLLAIEHLKKEGSKK